MEKGPEVPTEGTIGTWLSKVMNLTVWHHQKVSDFVGVSPPKNRWDVDVAPWILDIESPKEHTWIELSKYSGKKPNKNKVRP